MCVCTAVGMCSSTCILCTAFRMSTRANVPSLPYPLRSLLGYHGRCTYSPVLIPRAGTSFVQCFAWSAKRGQMCLVCPTPCAVRLGITGAEHTRPCWYLCWYLFRTVLRLVSRATYHLPGLVLVLVRPLRSLLGYHGRCTYSPVLVPRAGTSFVQCFTWSAKRGQMCLVFPTPCAVRLGITGAEHTRPCWYLCWYLFQRGQMCLVCPTPCAVCLGITGAEHTRPCWYLCWYLFRTVLRLVSLGNVSLARARTRTGTPLAQFAWVSRALYILARVGTSCWYLFCTVLHLVSQTRANVPSFPYPLRSSLGYHGG